MKITKKYISFSKALLFSLCVAFFIIIFFDAYVVLKLMQFVENGISLAYATVIGTVVSVMSTFSNAVVLFGVKHYLQKAAAENSVGYDSKTNTISEERIRQSMQYSCDSIEAEG